MQKYKILNEQFQYEQQRLDQRLGCLWKQSRQVRTIDFSAYGFDLQMHLEHFQTLKRYFDYSFDGNYFSIIQELDEPHFQIYIFDVLSESVMQIELQAMPIQIKFTRNSQYLLVEFDIKVIIYASQNIQKSCTILYQEIKNHLLFSDDADYLYLCHTDLFGKDAFIRIFDLQKCEQINQLKLDCAGIFCGVDKTCSLQFCKIFHITQNLFYVSLCFEDRFWRFFEENNYDIRCFLMNKKGKVLQKAQPYIMIEKNYGISITYKRESRLHFYNLSNAYTNKLIKRIQINQSSHLLTSFIDTNIIITFNDIIVQSWIYCYQNKMRKLIIVTEFNFLREQSTLNYRFYRYAGQKQINQNRAFVQLKNGAFEFNIF